MSSKRDLLALSDLTQDEMYGLLGRAVTLKRMHRNGSRVMPLAGKTLGMIFEKSSTRTRVSFEAGMFHLGGHALMLSTRDIQLGRGESVEDTARVLSRYLDCIMIRTFEHSKLTSFAGSATIPVINGLTDLLHPCQILADLLTIAEEFGFEAMHNVHVAWVGDGNNMANSWINAARVLGFHLRLACPRGYQPDAKLRAAAAGASVVISQSPAEAVEGANVVTTDVWTSMGQEAETAFRQKAFENYQVDTQLMRLADPSAIFLHCLPAHRGEEVTTKVIDGPQSRIFEEAENRMHVQKAVLEWLISGRNLG